MIFGKIFYSKVIHKSDLFWFSGIVCPKYSCEGHWIISIWIHVINELIAYTPLIISMYTYPSAAMSPSIWYWSLMSGGKYFECILVYSDLDIGVSKKNLSV